MEMIEVKWKEDQNDLKKTDLKLNENKFFLGLYYY
jgi:hypothetical protein